MSSILVATASESVRAAALTPLAREGVPVASVADFDSLLLGLCAPDTRLVLLDPELPRLQPELVAGLSAALAHHPTVRVIGGQLPPLLHVPGTERALLRLARAHAPGRGFSAPERRTLALLGLGPAPVERLARLATTTLPVLLQIGRAHV